VWGVSSAAEAETECVVLTLSTDLLVKVVSTGLSASDLCRLSCTCRRFLTVCSNECACGVGGKGSMEACLGITNII